MGVSEMVATGTEVSRSLARAPGGVDWLMVQWQSGEVRSGIAGFALCGQQAWAGSRWSLAPAAQGSAGVIARLKAIRSAKPSLRVLPMSGCFTSIQAIPGPFTRRRFYGNSVSAVWGVASLGPPPGEKHLYLEKPREGIAGISCTLGLGDSRGWCHRRTALGSVTHIPRNSYTGVKQRTVVGLVLGDHAHGHGLIALKPGGGFEMGALLAAMERNVTFRTIAGVIRAGLQCRCAAVTARGCNGLHKTGEPGAGDVDGRSGTGGFGLKVTSAAFPVAVVVWGAIAIAALSVFSVGVH